MMAEVPPGAEPQLYRVFIVDDHPIVRQGLVQLINQQADLLVCGEAEEASQALAAVIALQPDIVVVDIALKSSSGFELLRKLRQQAPALLLLVLSMHDETLYAERVLRAGGRGYVMKQEATDKVLTAIRLVLRGGIYVSERVAAGLLQSLVGDHSETAGKSLGRLSDRELEVLYLLGQGYSTSRIAEALHLSGKTIESHRANIMKKLHLQQAADLVQYAILWVNRMGEEP